MSTPRNSELIGGEFTREEIEDAFDDYELVNRHQIQSRDLSTGEDPAGATLTLSDCKLTISKYPENTYVAFYRPLESVTERSENDEEGAGNHSDEEWHKWQTNLGMYGIHRVGQRVTEKEAEHGRLAKLIAWNQRWNFATAVLSASNSTPAVTFVSDSLQLGAGSRDQQTGEPLTVEGVKLSRRRANEGSAGTSA